MVHTRSVLLQLFTQASQRNNRKLPEGVLPLAKRKLQQILLLLVVVNSLTSQEPRSVWSYPRFVVMCNSFTYINLFFFTTACLYCVFYYKSDHWWGDIVARTFTECDWMEILRMGKGTFDYLCQQLAMALHRQNTVMRRAVSVQPRVAITLWFLATPSRYRTISHLFEIHVAGSNVCEIVQETCTLIVRTLLNRYIQFPYGENLNMFVDGFKTEVGCPTKYFCN